ncbi:hypothetical protein [uncultured Microbacterium sp.]|uniref:hypothetical protein n=1 Tax=uncultured Microbacterium sp. TaxID=191216 RepID=UPI0025E365CF|nr:hypothetical protein [uncultured Microbacterium sp.]
MIAQAGRSVGVPELVWSRVDGDLTVATRAGAFAGYIDRRSAATYVLFDDHARQVGVFDDPGDARRALGTPPLPPRRTGLSALIARARTSLLR